MGRVKGEDGSLRVDEVSGGCGLEATIAESWDVGERRYFVGG